MLWNAQPQTGVTLIDSFEDQNLSEYNSVTVDMENFTTSPVFDGTYAHDPVNSSLDRIYSVPGDGLNAYFAKGEEANVYVRFNNTDDARVWAWKFGAADEDNCYQAFLASTFDNFILNKRESSNRSDLASTSVTYAADLWYRVNIVWDDGTLGGADNDITITLYDTTDGSQVGQVSANDSTYATNEGVGMYWNQENAGGAAYTDYWHKP